MRHLPPLLCLLLVLTSGLVAQSGGRVAVVAVEMVGTPVAILLQVDLSSGAVTPLGGFPSNGLAPRVIAEDRVNGDLLIAVDAGAGTSSVLRLQRSGTGFASERSLASFTGVVTDLTVLTGGDVYVLVTGTQSGLWRVPRWGGAPTLVTPLAAPVAFGFDFGGTWVEVLETGAFGPPVVAPQLSWVDTTTGVVSVSNAIAGASPPEVIGFLDLPTALIRHVLAHGDGSITLSVNFGTPTALPLNPPLGPGGAQVFSPGLFGSDALVVGGPADPFLRRFNPSTLANPVPVTTLAGPLPGVARDVAILNDQPLVFSYGSGCGGLSTVTVHGPAIGNANFALVLHSGLPQSWAGLAIGLSDRIAFGSLPLPAMIPGGCLLLVDPYVILPFATDPNGTAQASLPIPNDPALSGTIFFAQWAQVASTGYLVSNALAAHVH